jgi:uncharacterized protein
VNLRTLSTAAEFMDVAGTTLYANEAEDSLPLGVALRVLEGHRYGDAVPFFACVEKGRELPLIALRTPPHNLLLCARSPNSDALELVARHVAATGAALPGAQGRVGVVNAFAEIWCRHTGVSSSIAMEQRLYQLTEVTRPPDVPGRARWAEERDGALLTTWADAFIDEAAPGDPKSDTRAMIERTTTAHGLLVWDHGGAVSMCARTRPTPHGASIGLVYTPPAQRGRGYAAACVAELSQRILDSGKAFCTLFTDLANLTSNAIYQRIGYRPLADFREIRFSDVTARES